MTAPELPTTPLTTPTPPHVWTPDEMRALDRLMKAIRETRGAFMGMRDQLPDAPVIDKFDAELRAMRDHYWPLYEDMTLQNLKRQVW